MNNKTMDVRTALERGAQLPYAYIRSLSRVYLGKNPGTVDLDELLEARWFSKEQEIRLFSRQGEWAAACLSEGEGDDTLCQRYRLSNPMFGSELTMIRQLSVDEDGQTYVSATRLAGWKGAEQDG